MRKIKYFIEKYLENRPAFMAIIRSQEAILFEKNLKLIKQPILDFGCGDGFFSRLVFGKNRINIGLDITDSRIMEAKKEQVYKKVVTYDGKRIPYKNNHFQTIISNCVFEHLPNLNASLKEIYRILKPGGYLITTVMTNSWNKYLFGKKFFGNKYVNFMKKKQEHVSLLTEKKWVYEFEKNKFKVIKKIGYLNHKQSQKLDIWHYFSIPSLISYKFFGRWVVFPNLSRTIFSPEVKEILSDKDNKRPSAMFFILQKKVS